jgi:hypothetical protein
MKPSAELTAIAVEVCRVLAALPTLEAARCWQGPRPLLEKLRGRVHRLPCRDPKARMRLRRAIAWVDGHIPGGGNCYRRTLLEMALDRGAACEPLWLGLNVRDERPSGHAWLGTDGEAQHPYEVMIRV